jgi:hypothetical protein
MATQIALADLEGVIETESFISTESTRLTEGLSFALSGDMILPSAPPESGRMVLLDRTGANPITFADGQDATVISQLVVGTGFEALPSDYLEVGANRAFVSRFADNPEPGRLANDRGGDLLVIDRVGPDLVGSIALPRPDEVAPGPAGMARAGELVWVGLARTGSAPESSGDSMLAGVSIEREQVEVEHVLEGLRGCGRPAVSPSGELLAIACSGGVGSNGESQDAGASALVLLDPLADPPAEVRRFSAGAIAAQAIQSDVVFASERLVLVKTQDAAGQSTNNRWLAFDLEDESTQPIAEASPDEAERSRGTVYGAMSCAPGCSDVCLLTNAGDSVIERVRLSETGELELLEPIHAAESPELAPRGLVLY